jgi:hypothetical protein
MTGLVIGLILGIVGSLIAWYMTIGIITPALDIRDDMELIRTAGQPDEYRFAVRNRRIFRDAQDVSIRVRCSYLSHTRGSTGGQVRKFFDVPVDDGWIPIIRSQWYWRRRRPEGRTKNDHWPQLPTICRDEISSSYLNEVPKDNDGVRHVGSALQTSGQVWVPATCHDELGTLTVNRGSVDARDQHVCIRRSDRTAPYRSSKLVMRVRPALAVEVHQFGLRSGQITMPLSEPSQADAMKTSESRPTRCAVASRPQTPCQASSIACAVASGRTISSTS